MNPSYTGRFAPSPSGPLHFGSLVTAVASYVDAKASGGKWLVRIEDIDLPRTVPGAADQILRQLKSYGLNWDEEVIFQSKRSTEYQQALDHIREKTYWCSCSRKDIARCSCASAGISPKQGRSLKVRGEGNLEDFILVRADGCWAYQLAVVVDDAEQGITHVVRGADLLDSTPRQIYLQKLLHYRSPDYFHIPVVLDASGRKLSKQNHAEAVPQGDMQVIRKVVEFLGFFPPDNADPIEWAIRHWDRNQIQMNIEEIRRAS